MKKQNTHIQATSMPDDRALSLAGLRTFIEIAKAWGLNVEQQKILLGISASSTYHKWKKDPAVKLSKDTLERISYLLGIYKALQILLPNPNAADEWISKPNNAPLFNGQSALDRMLSGNVSDLYVVRRFLDAQRGGWS